MGTFHVNGRGEAGLCKAKISCPFGGEDQHHPSPEAARKAYETSMDGASWMAPTDDEMVERLQRERKKEMRRQLHDATVKFELATQNTASLGKELSSRLLLAPRVEVMHAQERFLVTLEELSTDDALISGEKVKLAALHLEQAKHEAWLATRTVGAKAFFAMGRESRGVRRTRQQLSQCIDSYQKERDRDRREYPKTKETAQESPLVSHRSF